MARPITVSRVCLCILVTVRRDMNMTHIAVYCQHVSEQTHRLTSVIIKVTTSSMTKDFYSLANDSNRRNFQNESFQTIKKWEWVDNYKS